VYPSSAKITINPNQAQVLRREARLLQTRIQDLKSAVSDFVHANREVAVTPLLRRNLTLSADALRMTEDEFGKLTTTEAQRISAQVFFDDLLRSYEVVISHFGKTRAAVDGGKFIPVSEAREASAEPLLSLALRPMEQNELAYKVVADEGSLTFDLEVDSTPDGAAVSYHRKGDPPRANPDPTRSTIRSLPYAVWIIDFEKSGYKREEREHDPFREPNHVVHVVLHKWVTFPTRVLPWSSTIRPRAVSPQQSLPLQSHSRPN
jgi:hypothetical protein